MHVAAALFSAFLHAAWNAAVKAGPRPAETMTAQMVMAAVIMLPGLAWTGLPAPASWPWIAASTGLNLVTVTALLRAYDIVGFGTAYPLVRALSVLLVVPIAALATGESVSRWGIAGIALVSSALSLLALGNMQAGAPARAAAGWIALSGVTTAAYVMCDAQGVRSAGSPWAYGCLVSITNAIVMSAWQRSYSMPWRDFAGAVGLATPIAVGSVASYLLILWVWSLAPVAPAAALRDTSAIFAILIAVVWLREPITGPRLAAVLLAGAAVPLLRLA